MNKNIIRKSNLNNPHSAKEDRLYWLSRPAEELVAAVDYLRKQYYGNSERLQRIARVINLADFKALDEE